MNQELESKKKFRDFNEVCEEAAKEINGTYKEAMSKSWEIGRVIAERRKEVNPKYGSGFIAGIANNMKEEPSIKYLLTCENLYNKYPDVLSRASRTGLSISHYAKLSGVGDREKASKLEHKAVQEKWSVRRLEQEIYQEPPQLDLGPDYEQKYNAWSSAATEFYTSLEELKEHFDKLAKDERDKIADNLFVFFTVKLPDVIEALIKSGATVRPEFKAYLKKIRGGDNEAR